MQIIENAVYYMAFCGEKQSPKKWEGLSF